MSDPYKYFSRKECLKGREVADPLSAEQEANLQKLLVAMNQFREIYGKPLSISSLYRPASINAAVGGAKKSNHIMCLAVDFVDNDGALAKFVKENVPVLEKLGLYVEDLAHTPGWVHLQIVSPKSGNRFFIP